ALHHRQMQIAAGVSAKLRVLQRRQAREQHPARFPRIAGERERTLENVAGRKDAELVAQLTRTAAAVEHGNDGVQAQPRVLLQPAQQTREARAAAAATAVRLAE